MVLYMEGFVLLPRRFLMVTVLEWLCLLESSIKIWFWLYMKQTVVIFWGKTKNYITLYLYGIEHCLCFVNQKLKPIACISLALVYIFHSYSLHITNTNRINIQTYIKN
jgi:hypothetical protein